MHNEREVNTQINVAQTRLHVIENEQAVLRLEKINIEKRLANLNRIKNELLQKGRNIEVIITDHAVLRYLERFQKQNIEEVRTKMLKDLEERVILAYGDGDVPYEDGRVTVRDFKVVNFEN